MFRWNNVSFVEVANRLNIHNEETLDFYVRKRDKTKPLITVTNHASCLDDPVLWGKMILLF